MSGKAAVQRAFKAIDWEKLSRVVVSEEGKREMAALKRAHDEVSHTLNTKFNEVWLPVDCQSSFGSSFPMFRISVISPLSPLGPCKQKVVEIDWALYRSKLNPKIVDMFEQSYKSESLGDF
ncbi:unnamed protein product [Closterium sp. NIES-54]